MQTALALPAVGSSCPFAELIFSIPPTHEGFLWDKAKWCRENDSGANQPLLLSATGCEWSQARKKCVPAHGGFIFISFILECTSQVLTEKKAFVRALLLGNLDPGSVGFADPGHAPSPLILSRTGPWEQTLGLC